MQLFWNGPSLTEKHIQYYSPSFQWWRFLSCGYRKWRGFNTFAIFSMALLTTYSIRQQKLNLFTPELPKQFSCLSQINHILKTCWLCFIFIPTNMMFLWDRKAKRSYSRQSIEQQGRFSLNLTKMSIPSLTFKVYTKGNKPTSKIPNNSKYQPAQHSQQAKRQTGMEWKKITLG